MWKRSPHLMQQHETPRKGEKINNIEHYNDTSCYNKSLIIIIKEGRKQRLTKLEWPKSPAKCIDGP